MENARSRRYDTIQRDMMRYINVRSEPDRKPALSTYVAPPPPKKKTKTRKLKIKNRRAEDRDTEDITPKPPFLSQT